MLEIFDQNPQSRVFHVDRECYIVYLGSHWEDYKPFLRLGTSPDLPADLPPIVSTIVVPDVMTGNPLDEPACLAGDATPETHYVGDLETVEHMKSFVGQQTIPVEAIEAIDHEEDDGKHVLVYYYRDGNLKIKFRKNEVFDLRRREKLDGHFVARAQDAKNEYGRSPFKLPGDSYQDPGFVVVSGKPYLVALGELAALELSSDYFFDLSAAGLDADRISAVHADDADASLIRYFKRSRTRNRAVRVSSPRGPRVTEASQLFPENSLPSLKAKVIEGHGGAFEFHRFRVNLASGRFETTLEALDGPIVFLSGAKKRAEGAVVVDTGAGSLSLARAGVSFPLLDGAIYQLRRESLTRSAIEERFLPAKTYPYRDLISAGENTLIGQLQYFFNELFAGRDVGKVVRTIKALDQVKAIGRPGSGLHPVVQVVLHNYGQYLSFLRDHESEAARGLEALAPVLDRHEIARAEIPAMLPLIGQIIRDGDREYLFYRIAARVTSDRYAHAERVVEKVRATPMIDFAAERKRLADLVAGLATPEQMDEARMRRIAEAQKKRPAKPTNQAAAASDAGSSDASKESATAGAAERASADRAGSSSTGRAGAGRTGQIRRGSGARWIIPVAAILVVLLALLALLYTNVIPNRWFGGPTSIASADSDNGAATAGSEAGEDGADGVATTDESATANDETSTADQALTGPGTSGGENDGSGTSAAGESAGNGTNAGDEVSTTTSPQLPEGWPPNALPAIRALSETPGVTITRTRVIGPGGIEITLRDIIALVNRIASENGYATMDAIDSTRPDPDWIYPGNVFVLPNSARYTVVQGDTLWEITVRYMVARLRDDYNRYTDLVAEHDAADTSETRKGQIAETLRAIGADSHTENFSRLVEQTLAKWGE